MKIRALLAPWSLLSLSVLALMALILPLQAYDQAQAAYSDAMQSSQARDWKAAISKFDSAIELNPQYGDAYYHRGYAKTQLGDMDGAIADYSKAVSINPRMENAYTSRGLAKYHQNDIDGAIADYDQAVSLNSMSGYAYLNRGVAKMAKGSVDEAIEDLSKAAQVNRSSAQASKMLGYAEYEKALNPTTDDSLKSKAVEDLRRSADLDKTDSDYPQVFIWLIQAGKADQIDAATRDLSEYINLRPGKTDDWPIPAAQFFIGNLSENDLLRAASSGDKRMLPIQQCEAFFYIGMKHAYAGDNTGAVSFFQQCLKTGQMKCVEYQMAKIRLTQLQPSNPMGG